MQPGGEGWPIGPWRLTAPESYILLHGPKGNGKEAFKLGLMELVARGVLRLSPGDPPTVARGPKPAATVEPALAAIRDAYRSVGGRHGSAGVPVRELAAAARKVWGGLDRYTKRVVLLALASRGLYAREERRILWIFPATRFVLTPAGEAAQADLRAWLAVGQGEARRWTGSNAALAAAFLGSAGAAALLLQPIPPQLQQLQRRQLQGGHADSTGSTGSSSTGGDDEGRERPEPGEPAPPEEEPGGGDFSLDLDLDAFGGFDSLDSAFASIDSGVDSGDGGSSDGGGGDGGGDGGGGGE